MRDLGQTWDWPETDLRLTWDWPMSERWRFSALDKLVPDGRTDRQTERQSDSLGSLTEPKRFYVFSFEQKKCDIWVGINLTFTLKNKSSGTLDKMRCSNLQNKQNKHTRSLLWPLTTWKWKYRVINSSRKRCLGSDFSRWPVHFADESLC